MWKNCFLNKGVKSDLILLGTADKHDFLRKQCNLNHVQSPVFMVSNGPLVRVRHKKSCGARKRA